MFHIGDFVKKKGENDEGKQEEKENSEFVSGGLYGIFSDARKSRAGKGSSVGQISDRRRFSGHGWHHRGE